MFMTDHPGWLSADDGIGYRVVTSGKRGALIMGGRDETDKEWFHPDRAEIRVHTTALEFLFGPPDLLAPLTAMGSVARLANPSLWGPLGVAIIRRAAPASHARCRWQQHPRTTRSACRLMNPPFTLPLSRSAVVGDFR